MPLPRGLFFGAVEDAVRHAGQKEPEDLVDLGRAGQLIEIVFFVVGDGGGDELFPEKAQRLFPDERRTQVMRAEAESVDVGKIVTEEGG